jgi:hypothetical protein
VLTPVDEKVYDVGLDVVHGPEMALGVVDEVDNRYPSIPILSLAVSVVIGTVREDEVDGIIKEVIRGLVVSGVVRVIVVASDLRSEIFPASSLAQA